MLNSFEPMNADQLPRVLCVDDEPHVLSGLERTLFDSYDVTTAGSGAEALEIIGEEAPFAVIISDMRMPQMNGATFLAHARSKTPDTVRMLLTGHSEVEAAISAINDGQIFRFLCKPCPETQLKDALAAGVSQYALITAERQLLENTLNGAVKALTDTLSLAAPQAFQRSTALQRMVKHMHERLREGQWWRLNLAALLAPIGCITLPTDVVARAYSGLPLSDAERQMIQRHPEAGRLLIHGIPRLEEVAEMIGGQYGRLPADASDEVMTGAAMLRLANEIESGLRQGGELGELLVAASNKRIHPKRLIDALSNFHTDEQGAERPMTVAGLRPGMVVVNEVVAKNDTVLIAKGRQVDEVLIRRLQNFAERIGVREPFMVRLPE